MLNKVKLANGIEVDWEEFSLWSTQKQKLNLIPRRQSEETRRKCGEARKGKVQTEETRRKISETRVRKGISHSDETRRKISETKRGIGTSEETRRKLSDVNKGKVLSQETRRKLSDVNKGKVLSQETRNKISEAHKQRSSLHIRHFLEFRDVHTPHGIFKHINAVAYFEKCDVTTIRRWMTKWPDRYHFVAK